jgi:hypothetical protein
MSIVHGDELEYLVAPSHLRERDAQRASDHARIADIPHIAEVVGVVRDCA